MSNQQVKIFDTVNETVHGGIQLENGDIICACCGSIFKADELEDMGIKILEVYSDWVDFSYAIFD